MRSKQRSAKIMKLLINIPIAMENPTNPSLYSFFNGLKYVLTKRGSEKRWMEALLSDAKKLTSTTGASMYQNLRKIKGKDR